MALSLFLLGVLRASRDGQPITEFYSGKVRALLAYLAVEDGRPHARPVLAALLWPDWDDRAALGNLRFSLSKLRQAINDQDAARPFLLINRETIQVNPVADVFLDVRLFQQELQAGRWEAADVDGQPEPTARTALEHLTAAMNLYRGSFLEGLSAGDSPAFEEWALIKREQIEREARWALHGMTALHGRLGDYAAAERCARRLLDMDPWDDLANRRLMLLLVQDGQRNAALRHYAAYREELAKELGAEPTEETVALYERIRRGQAGAGADRPSPAASGVPMRSATVAAPLFVAREPQLAQLDRLLGRALAGQGLVAFVTGEAGSGKTALLAEFARRAAAKHRGLLLAGGRCNAYTGLGDPYLPFREAVQMLTGDASAGRGPGEAGKRAFAVPQPVVDALLDATPELAARIVLPQALKALLHSASASGSSALSAAWQSRLDELAKHPAKQEAGLEQATFFSQFTEFLLAVARGQPLLLSLDDLQWADKGSLSLLFHLGRRLSGARILVVGAYRPEEVAAGGVGGRHPLSAVVNELKQVHGDVEVNLNEADGRPFVAAFLDSEANHLEAPFRDTLYHHTGGQPLFTIELLRGLQERGELVRDATGAWIEARTVNWDHLPPRVEAVIAERVDRLPLDAARLLAAASVEGEEFTAEVVAHVLQMDKAAVLHQLSDVLGKHHRLVRGCGVLWPADAQQPLYRYRFQHFLFQQYLYEHLDPAEQACLHGLVGEAIERFYGAKAPGMAVHLARHFERAGSILRAVEHLQEVGDQAMWSAAYHEAAASFTRGLNLLAAIPKTPERTGRELRLYLSLAGPLTLLRGAEDAARTDTAAVAATLSRDAGSVQVIHALFVAANSRRDRGDYQGALELGRRMLDLAEASGERVAAMLAHYILGSTAAFSGDSARGRADLEAGLRLYADPEDNWFVALAGADLKALIFGFLVPVLWALGYADQAAASRQAALDRARALHQPATLAIALVLEVWLSLYGRTGEDVRPQINTLHRLVIEKGVELVHPWSTVFDGWLAAQGGRSVEGVADLRSQIVARGRALGGPGLLAIIAQACLDHGLDGEGLQAVNDALAMVEDGVSRYYEPELYRLRGVLRLGQSGHAVAAAAEQDFLKAIDLARGNQARSWELRAGVDLARLWREQGKTAEARALLEGIYGWFTEGFDTTDLREARAFLEELASPS